MVSIVKKNPIRGCFAVLVFATAVLCVQAAQAQTNKVKYGVTNPLGGAYLTAASVAKEQTRFVFYRAAKPQNAPDAKAGVVSVYLDDRYHASLQREAFSVICIAGKKIDIRTRYLADPTSDISSEFDAHRTIAVKGGESVYLRVAELADSKSRIDIVSPQVAANDLINARQQMHTLSRVPSSQPCRLAEETPSVLDANVITFGSDAIFESKKTEINAISAEGKQELKNIVQKINIKYKTFADIKVHVVGFADDEDDELANQRISQERAKSVRAYFKSQGLRSTALTFEGRGSVNKDRASLFGLSPRRVEVEVAVDIH